MVCVQQVTVCAQQVTVIAQQVTVEQSTLSLNILHVTRSLDCLCTPLFSVFSFLAQRKPPGSVSSAAPYVYMYARIWMYACFRTSSSIMLRMTSARRAEQPSVTTADARTARVCRTVGGRPAPHAVLKQPLMKVCLTVSFYRLETKTSNNCLLV